MIRVGLVGYGFMGKMHSACYGASGKAKVAAVADIQETRRKEAAEKLGCATFDSIGAMLGGCELDAVDVCTPTYLHEPHVLAVAAAKKHIFCEKPLSLTTEACERMIAAAKSAGVILQIGHVVRFWPDNVVVKSVLDSGRLGKLLWASARRLSAPATWDWDKWLSDPARSGGAILDLHIHDLDYLAWVLGRPKQVACSAIPTATGAFDTALTTFIGQTGGATCQAEGCLAMPEGYPFTARMLFVCEKGAIDLDITASPTVVVRPAGAPEEHPEIPQPQVESNDAGGNVSSLGGYFNEIVYFLDCVKENRLPTVITPEEAAYAVRVCLAAAESAKTGKIVTV